MKRTYILSLAWLLCTCWATAQPTEKEQTKSLLKALKNPSREYRNIVLDAASSSADTYMYIDVMKVMIKAKPEVKVDILNWLGREASGSLKKKNILKDLEVRFELFARQIFINELKDPSFEVKQATAWVMTQIADKTYIPSLAGLLTDSDKKVVLMAQKALSDFPGDIDQAVSQVIPKAGDDGKIAGLQLLATRKANANSSTVYNQLESPSQPVKEAAYAALKEVVTKGDFVRLCGMLETTQVESDIKSLQQAIVASLALLEHDEQVSILADRMIQAGASRKYLYDPIVEAVRSKQAN